MTNTAYFTLWNKYRPVIIRLMIAAEDNPKSIAQSIKRRTGIIGSTKNVEEGK